MQRLGPLVRSGISFIRSSGRQGLIWVLLVFAFQFRNGCERDPTSPKNLREYLDGEINVSSLVYPLVEMLQSKHPRDRRKAAKTLRGWLEEVQSGIHSGDIEWIQTPYMNLPEINRGWDLIWELPQYLGGPLSEESIAISTWYLAQSGSRFHSEGISILRNIKGEKANRALVSLITMPHANQIVVRGAVEEVIERNLAVPAEAIRSLAASHRPKLAAAARQLNQRLGYPPLAPYDSLSALESPVLLDLMSQVDSLVVDRIPPTAKYVQLRYTEVWPGINTNHYRVNGWLLEQNARAYVLYDLYGTFVRSEWSQTTRDAFGEISYTRTVKMKPLSLEDEAVRIREPEFWGRQSADTSHVLSEGPWSISLVSRGGEFARPEVFEIHFAWWLFHYGPRDLCARVLLNAIEDYPTDEAFIAAARIGIGERLGLDMMVAFVGRRDYDEASRIARLIVSRYPDSPYADEASLLSTQLPARGDDFQSFRLPTAREWETIRKGLSREGQIAYLCDRFRLLNCDNGHYAQEQSAEPAGLSSEATNLLETGRKSVINPYTALLPDWQRRHADSASVSLEFRDLPMVARYLADDRVILSVCYPVRRGGNARWLDRVSAVAASLINAVADSEVCSVHEFGRLQGEARQNYVRGVTAWAERQRGKTLSVLLRERLRGLSKSYEKVRCLETLARLEGRGALADIMQTAEQDSLEENDLRRLLDMRRMISSEAMVPLALRLTNHDSRWVRRVAAITLIEAGREEGRALLRRELREDGLTRERVYDLIVLLRNPTPNDTELADSLLSAAHDSLMQGRERGSTLSGLLSVNRPEGYRWLLEALSDTSETGSAQGHPSGWIRPRIREVVAADVLQSKAVPEYLRIEELFGLSYKGRGLAIERLKAWAQGKIRE